MKLRAGREIEGKFKFFDYFFLLPHIVKCLSISFSFLPVKIHYIITQYRKITSGTLYAYKNFKNIQSAHISINAVKVYFHFVFSLVVFFFIFWRKCLFSYDMTHRASNVCMWGWKWMYVSMSHKFGPMRRNRFSHYAIHHFRVLVVYSCILTVF